MSIHDDAVDAVGRSAKYAGTRDSDPEWQDNVPAHWETPRLRTVADVRLSSVDKHSRSHEQAVRLCNYIDVYKNDRIHSGIAFMPATATSAEIDRFRLQPGDVLITKDSETWTDIGVPALVETTAAQPEADVLCGYHCALLRPHGRLRGRYLFWFLRSSLGGNQFHGRANGVTRYGLSQTAIKSVRVPVPPIPEQTAIIRFLGHVDVRVRRAIREKVKLLALLDERRLTVIEQAVTGQIDVRTGKPFTAYKDSGVDWLRRVPAHWTMRRNKWLFAERNETGHGDLPVLEVSLRSGVGIRNLDDGVRKQQMADRDKYKRAARHDMAYNTMRLWQGAIGVVPTDGLVSPAYVVARPLRGVEVPYYAYLFRTDGYKQEVDRNSRGIVSDRNRLYWDAFKRLASPCPPPEEQRCIVEYLEAASDRTNAGAARARRQIALLREYRERLIADVVTGKVDVREATVDLPEVAPRGTVSSGTAAPGSA